MSDKSSGGPNIGLLLLIPAAAIVARAAMRHHQMMWSEIGEAPSPGPRRGHGHRHFGGPGFDPTNRGEFRLPPRIEWMLDTWHERAHQEADPEPPEAATA